MNGQNEDQGDDDYTWDGGSIQAAAVFMAARTRDGEPEPGTADAWADRWQRQAARTHGAGPDLRTADQVERDDVAQLTLRCDNLVDCQEAMGRRVTDLETIAVDLVATVVTLVKLLDGRL